MVQVLNTIRYDTIRYDTIRYDTIRYDTIRYDTIRYDTIRYDTIRYDIWEANAKSKQYRVRKTRSYTNFSWTILDMFEFSNILAINTIKEGRAIVTSAANTCCCSSSST